MLTQQLEDKNPRHAKLLNVDRVYILQLFTFSHERMQAYELATSTRQSPKILSPIKS
jgi:hypothetical protein